jgi:hypothetical protein
MLRAIPAVALLAAFGLSSGCAYSDSLKPGDTYILILIAGLVVMGGVLGSITQTRNQILDREVIQVQRHKEAIHAAEDEIRLKRESLYRAQQELLGVYDKLLTEAQRRAPELVAMKRRLLDAERDILNAENQRNQLIKQTSA